MKEKFITLTNGNDRDVIIIINNITHIEADIPRPGNTKIFLTGGTAITVKENLDEIKRALRGEVETKPTDDTVK